MRIQITDTFIASLTKLSPADLKRATLFLDRLVREPDSGRFRPEIVHDAADRTIRSLRVTEDLRAIAQMEADRVALLYVARHDQAYAWARDRCIECHPVTGEIQIIADPSRSVSRLAATGAIEEAARIATARPAPRPLFEDATDETLLALGVPSVWLEAIRMVRSEDMLLAIADDLPAQVAERLIALAIGEPVRIGDSTWACDVADRDALCALLERSGVDHGLGS
jgi:mRNA-degrading endonuclease RelE of RelBE toxin-antitoxin system